jgi:hypothetical protein
MFDRKPEEDEFGLLPEVVKNHPIIGIKIRSMKTIMKAMDADLGGGYSNRRG